jgi:hypothetical protein
LIFKEEEKNMKRKTTAWTILSPATALVFALMLMLLTVLALRPSTTQAYGDVYVFISEKQEKIKQSRWSLSDWLLTKKKIALMDQWLALNSSSSLFEGFVIGRVGQYRKEVGISGQSTSTVTTGNQLIQFGTDLYLAIFGVHYLNEQARHDYQAWEGHFNLRLLGKTAQGTNLTAFYGYRSLKNPINYPMQYWGGSLTLYLFSFLGVEGQYRTYIRAHSTDRGATDASVVKGSKSEATAFLDLGFVRVYATAFQEQLDFASELSSAFVARQDKRSGILGGLNIYF